MRLPQFLIIGAQRCGTTSLFLYLSQHPAVAPPSQKEIHYFDLYYDKGSDWYAQQFPAVISVASVTGEASPYYLFHPHVPLRVRTLLPDVKLIVLLRNPSDRAYSHFHHEVRLGAEKLSFEMALDYEEERLRDETAKMLADDGYYSFNHQHYSYRSRGEYVTQLLAWRELFPRDQFLILKSEDLYGDPATVFQSTTEFIGVPEWQPQTFRKHNEGQYAPMSDETRTRLAKHFRPWNQRLYEYLRKDLGWDT